MHLSKWRLTLGAKLLAMAREQATVKLMLAHIDARFEERPAPQVGEFDLPAPRITPPAALAIKPKHHRRGNRQNTLLSAWIRKISTEAEDKA